MVEMALVIGAVVTAAARWACRSVVRQGVGLGETTLIVMAATGLLALAIVALEAGAVAAALVACVAATCVTVDVRRVRAALRRRLAARHGSTVTPFQNAT